MGGTACKGPLNGNKAITIAILGLDNAGKTTTARVLEKAPVDSVAPTIGFSQTEITHKNERIKLIDLGGAKTFREAWRHYYDDAYGFVYVLDSSEESRLGENREVLKKLLQEEKVKGKPILILANKQDKAEALDKNAILEDLRIERLVNENQTLCRVELCTAKSLGRTGKNSKIDESIRHGFDWLIKTVYENHDSLKKRVDLDVQKRTEIEQVAKRERQERIQKLREEREQEEGTQDDNNEEEETIKNGFVPIENAVKNAERHSLEKPPKDRSNRLLSNEKAKSKTVNENASLPPKPAPRSSSNNRALTADDNSEGQVSSRRHSIESSPRRKESPVPRSVPANFDENQQIDSTDEQTSTQVIPRKKKKVIGIGRNRLNGDNLPPLAPSSASSRRDDFPQNKGAPVGTPRPKNIVAQWAITSPIPQAASAEKLTTITSDNEVDDDEEKYKLSDRIKSPHPKTKNRIVHDKKNQLLLTNNTNDETDERLANSDDKNSSRDKRRTDLHGYNDNNDEGYGDSSPRRSSARQKPSSKLNDEDDNDRFGQIRKKPNGNEQDHYTKQRYDRNDDYDNNNINARKQNLKDDGDNNKSSRHKRQTNFNNDDDDDDDNAVVGEESSSRRLSARQKSRSKVNDDNEPSEPLNSQKRNDSKEQNRYSKQRNEMNHDIDADLNSRSNRQTVLPARKTNTGDSSHRSYSKTDANTDDDLR